MTNNSRDKLKPLIYVSYDDLKAQSNNMDKNLFKSLKRMDAQKCFKHFVELEREGRMRRQEGDEEQAYIFYHRAMHIFQLINEKKDSVFRRGKDGHALHNISERMLIDLEKLGESLKMRFDQQHCASTVPIVEPPQMDDVFGEKVKMVDGSLSMMCAKPRTIVNYVESGKNVLVLDYRSDQGKIIQFRGIGGSMDVVHINREIIVLGSLIQSIVKALDISVRPTLSKISQFDLVVLIDDGDASTRVKCNKTRILYEALTTYNIRSKLKRPPVLIDGGFASWQNAYPCYVSSCNSIDNPVFEKTFEEQFSIWLEQSREANKFLFDYPTLLEDIGPKKAVSSPEEPPIPSAGSNKPKVPIFDRSKKPAKHQNPCVSPAKDDSIATNIQSTSDIVQNKENQAPVNLLKNVTIRKPESPSSPPSTISSFPSVPAQISSRPPIPDRNTKNDVLMRHQQHQTSYFRKIFVMTKAKIADASIQKHIQTRCGCTGLVNMGNTCFMNATLQALFHTPEFSQLFRNGNVEQFINSENKLGTHGIISGCFSALIDLAYSGEYSALRPSFFLDLFAERVNATLADRRQHDAQEFQTYLLDALHEDTNQVVHPTPFEQNYDSSNLRESAENFFKNSKKFSSSPVNDLFNLTTISVLQCMTCKTTSVRFEGLNQLSVELPTNGRPLKLRECLNAHFSTSALDDLWDCPHCKSKQAAVRATKIWKMPKVLIIHLKRFSFTGSQFVKNEAEICFDPVGFDLSQYLHYQAPICGTNYNLYAITNHNGNLNSGHYTSFVKNLASDEREWLHFDDERCICRSTPSSSSKQAFLLYYTIADNRDEFGKSMV